LFHQYRIYTSTKVRVFNRRIIGDKTKVLSIDVPPGDHPARPGISGNGLFLLRREVRYVHRTGRLENDVKIRIKKQPLFIKCGGVSEYLRCRQKCSRGVSYPPSCSTAIWKITIEITKSVN